MTLELPKLAVRPMLEPQYLHVPKYVETFGPEVGDLCARADFAPDPEQQLILDAVFAIRPDGLPATFENDIVGPRQNLKTGVLKMIDIGWLYITKSRLIVHSAHELDTTAETFRDLSSMIEEYPFLSRELLPTRGPRDGITDGNGKWAIELKGDRRLRFKARTATGGRGLTASKLVLDEYFRMSGAMVGALFPTMAAVRGAQIVAASSGGLLESEQLRDKRDRGRKGSTERQFYIEFTDLRAPTPKHPNAGCKKGVRCDHAKDAVGCALDDEERWKKIMTALGTRVMPETIRSLRQAMPPMEFAREFMVWWEDPPDDEDVGVFGVHWNRQNIEGAKMPTPRCLALAGSPAGGTSLAAVGDYGDDGMKVVFPARTKKGEGGNRPGRKWAVPTVVKLAKKHGLRVAIAEYGPAADLVDPLIEQLGEDRVIVADMGDLKDAVQGLYDGITESHDIFHDGSKEATTAARKTVKRMSSGRFLLGGRTEGDDVSMIEAEALAWWGDQQPVPEASEPMAAFG